MNETRPINSAWWWALAVLALLTALVWNLYFTIRPDGLLHADFFDVGQGDSIFLQSPSHSQVLIDGGPDGTVLRRLSSVMPFFDRTIDLVILTHPHADHVAGLIDVLRRYRVKNILLSGMQAKSATYGEFTRQMQAEGARIITARAGVHILLDPQTELRILAPSESMEGKMIEDLNETSVVVRMVYGSTRILLTGDAPQGEERQILSQNWPVASDVLKVGHHGSRGSSSDEFLAAVHPSYAVISAGRDNRYNHPHEETLQRLQARHIPALITASEGNIRFLSDGRRIWRE